MRCRHRHENGATVNGPTTYRRGVLDDRGPQVARLLDAVDAAFEQTGAGFARWPAPHPDRAPLDEEYSRILARLSGGRVRPGSCCPARR